MINNLPRRGTEFFIQRYFDSEEVANQNEEVANQNEEVANQNDDGDDDCAVSRIKACWC